MLAWQRHQQRCERSHILSHKRKNTLRGMEPVPLTQRAIQVLKTQLAPVLYMLEQKLDVCFHFVNAPFEAPAAIGVKDQYEGPFFSFFDQQENNYGQMLSIGKTAARMNLPPEDHCREIRRYGLDPSSWSACNFLDQMAQQHTSEPFEGVLGFSEGASVAVSYILRQSRNGNTPFRFAIFLCAQPPFDWRTKGSLLADEISDRVQIPTAHIVGRKDPGYKAGLALLHICDQRQSKLFEHEGGHTIPWNLATTQGIVNEICEVIIRANAEKDDLELLPHAD